MKEARERSRVADVKTSTLPTKRVSLSRDKEGPPDQQPIFEEHHLLAQHEGRQPPAGASPATFNDVRGILHGLGESLTPVVNEARGRAGWPLRAVAELLLQSHEAATAPADAPI